MKYSNEQIKKKLISCSIKDLKNGRYFYSLKDVLKEFEIKHFEVGLIAQTQIRKKLESISYPCGAMFQLQKNKGGIVEDVYLSPTGLMFTLATLSQMLTKNDVKDLSFDIACVIKEEQNLFYPERRLFFREEYKSSFKELSSRVKQLVDGDKYRSLSSHLSRLHYTILSDYYFVTEIDSITYKKTGTYSKNYLDYISLRELKDLTEIQKTLIKEISKNPSVDFIELAGIEATKRRRDFFLNYAGKYPFEYKAHNNTPKKMIKEFDDLLIELNLEKPKEYVQELTK